MTAFDALTEDVGLDIQCMQMQNAYARHLKLCMISCADCHRLICILKVYCYVLHDTADVQSGPQYKPFENHQ